MRCGLLIVFVLLLSFSTARAAPDNPDGVPTRLEDCQIEQSVVQFPDDLAFSYISSGPFYICLVLIYDSRGPWPYYVPSSDHHYELVFDGLYTARLWAKGAPPQMVEYLLGAPGIVYVPVIRR
jgi:hypothetical protein